MKTNKRNNSIIFLKDWKLLVCSLPCDDQIEFWDLFTSYEYGKVQVCTNISVLPIWLFIKSQLDNMKEEYENTVVNRNRENGAKGGRPKNETQKTQNNPSVNYKTQKTLNENENENENVNEKDNVNDFLLEKETKEILPNEDLKIDLVNPETKEAKKVAQKKVNEILHIPEDFISLWNDWTEYRKLRKFKAYASPKYEQMAVDKLLELSGCDPIIASKILQNTFTNNYQGFFPLKENQNGNSNTGQSNSNGNGNSGSHSQAYQGGKSSFNQILARKLTTASNSESGNITIDAEVVE